MDKHRDMLLSLLIPSCRSRNNAVVGTTLHGRLETIHEDEGHQDRDILLEQGYSLISHE
jgi:hypothetical protein